MGNQAIQKLNGDIGTLETTIRIEAEKTNNFVDTIEANMCLMETKMDQ